ncbi:MAG: DUF805 domain-containing protein [Alphaproteobacteria bacterium]|jgi:uncharacterized membrane protein YhaH (DUF805 family)|nr:DUF805 domain-containing protein [Alphaproteobacteria bacterium]
MTRLFFGFGGRLGRLDYFLRWLGLVAATMVAAIAVGALGPAADAGGRPVTGSGAALTTIGFGLIAIAMLWAALSLAVRRGHDIGWPAWLTLVPVIGLPAIGLSLPASSAEAGAGAGASLGLVLSLAPTLVLLALPGERIANGYGPPPHDDPQAAARLADRGGSRP